MRPQSIRVKADETVLPDENWGNPLRVQRQSHERLLYWDATTLLAVIVTALLGVHRQSVAFSEEPEPIAEPIKPISVSDPEPTANPILQSGTNNLRTRGHIRDIAFSPGGRHQAPDGGAARRKRDISPSRVPCPPRPRLTRRPRRAGP